jgi:peptidoglycan/LPS O-acetylase OafA/YrhL
VILVLGSAQSLDDIHNPSFVSFLNLARWAAAAVVFLGHLRDPLFLGYQAVAPPERTVAVKVWFFVTGWHGAAVVVFFVLSGFLVGGIGCAKATKGQFSPLDYSVDRATRLFVPYLPALLLTAALDGAGVALLGDVGFWNHTHPILIEKVHAGPLESNLTPALFVANALMLQTFFTAAFGSNLPLWTISAEFWFYVVFGAALTGILAALRSWRLAMFVVAFAATATLGAAFIPLLGLWTVGVVAGLLSNKALRHPILAALTFLAVLVVTRMREDMIVSEPSLILRNFAIALSFGWLLVAMRSPRFGWLERAAQLNSFMASFSYSLYLIHFPLMLFIMGALYKTGAFPGIASGYSPTDVRGLTVYAFVIVAVFACSYGFSLLTERQTPKLRHLLKRALRPEPKSPEAAPSGLQ